MYSKLKSELRECILEALTKMKIKYDEEIVFEEPPNPELGDISTNIAFTLTKKMQKSPVEIAEQIKSHVKLPLYFNKVQTAGPYLNFFIDYTLFSTKMVNYIDRRYG
ncbi:MAG: arginine--tRNA ligase, partial [Methanosphaera sp. rholeuAM74]